jgi:hypothetical protein
MGSRTAMTRIWAVEEWRPNSETCLEALLEAGWEPFAGDSEVLWLRKRKECDNLSHQPGY